MASKRLAVTLTVLSEELADADQGSHHYGNAAAFEENLTRVGVE